MDIYELGRILNDMYFNAEEGEAVAMIHLFAIKYATEIRATGCPMVELARAGGIRESYGTEISKGVKLARYVTPKLIENSPIEELTMTLEAEFDIAMMGIYESALSEAGYRASAFLTMLHTHRGLETAQRLIHSSQVSSGYTALWERGRLDLTVEALITENSRWHSLFSEQELTICRRRLSQYNYQPRQ